MGKHLKQISAGAFALSMSSTATAEAQNQREPKASQFSPRGLLALRADAFGAVFEAYGIEKSGTATPQSTVAVVEVVGPLMHHRSWFFDSYDGIKERVCAALATSAKCVLLSVDSPGGLVAGCFDTVAEIRRMAAAAGKKLYAYVDAQSSSAAYALACAGEKIFIPSTGFVGSIGVIDTLVDQTAADAEFGTRFVIVTSGARKSDGNPHVSITDEAIAAAQAKVDTVANQFWALVSERRGISVDAVRALECAELCGQQAIDAKLADQIATLDEVVAMLAAADEETAQVGTNKGATTVSGIADAKAALKSVADDEKADEKERVKARKALAAMDETEDDKPKGEDDNKDDSAAEDEEDESKAEGKEDGSKAETEDDADKEKPHEEPDGDEEKKATKATKAQAKASSALALAARVQELEKTEARRAAKAERAKLMASRPDFAQATVKWLSEQPLSVLRTACAKPEAGGLPLGPGKAGQIGAARAALTSNPTMGDGANMAPPESPQALGYRSDLSGRGKELDELMGISRPAGEIKMAGNTLQLGVMSPDQARAFRAQKGGAK